MSGLEHFYLWAVFVMVTIATVLTVAIGIPPRHCQYMVAVKSALGVYACSENPKVKSKP